jgi:hypothetical protein
VPRVEVRRVAVAGERDGPWEDVLSGGNVVFGHFKVGSRSFDSAGDWNNRCAETWSVRCSSP